MDTHSRILSTENRYVYEHDGVVVKLGCGSDVLSGSQNRVELDTWLQVAHTDIGHLFAPILDGSADGSWLTMPYVRPLNGPAQTLLWRLKDELSLAGRDVYDLSRHNIGFYQGRAVVLDYGHTSVGQADYIANGRQFCGVCKYCALTFR